MTADEDVEKVDKAIYDLLINRSKPDNGLTVREMTRIIWHYKEGDPSNEQFYNRAKLLERRIGAVRRKIFANIRRALKKLIEEDERTGRKRISVKVARPEFIPYALPVKKYWRYFNAANYEQMKWVIKGLRHKADGLNANAEVLEAVF